MEWIPVYAIVFWFAVLLQRQRYSTTVREPAAWLEYQKFSFEYEQRRFEECLAVNSKRWEECKEFEDEAWRRRSWDLEELYAWWELFCQVHGIELDSMLYYPFEFRKYRAVMLSGDREEFYFPNLPKPLPRPQEMWWRWEAALVRPGADVIRSDETVAI